ncbi:MAG: hypothetical protein ACK4IY_07750, partial [Chitinophagales bacterium]
MKRSVLFIIFTIQISVAWTQDVRMQWLSGKHAAEQINLLPQKVNSTNFRLIQVDIDSINGAAFTPLNQITYTYSGERGGNYLHNLVPFASGTIDFDTSVVKAYTGSLFIPTHRILRNYNADNLVSEEKTELFDLTAF